MTRRLDQAGLEVKSVVMTGNMIRHWMRPNLYNTICGRFGWEEEPKGSSRKFRNCKMCTRIARHFKYKRGGPLIGGTFNTYIRRTLE